jgi:small-conductance mechanosensitive channel
MSLTAENKLIGGTSIIGAAVLFMVVRLHVHFDSLLYVVDADARHALTIPLLMIGKLAITPIFLIKTCLFLILLTLAAGLVRKALYRRVLGHTNMAPQYRYTIARFGAMLVYVCGLVAGLESVGLNLGSLAILGGTLGIGIGFGLQPLVGNWVSGLVLLIEQPIRIGDRIDLAGMSGVVMRIGGRSTWVRTYDNEVIIVPNSDFTSHRITNWTANDPKIRLSISVGVDYNSDLDDVRSTLEQIARQHPLVLSDPPAEAVVTQLADSAVNLVLRFWTMVQPTDNLRLESDLYCAMVKTLKQKGIAMPFPQMDLHLRPSDGTLMVAMEAGAGGPVNSAHA